VACAAAAPDPIRHLCTLTRGAPWLPCPCAAAERALPLSCLVVHPAVHQVRDGLEKARAETIATNKKFEQLLVCCEFLK